jgi:prephenate dehydrogenase
MTVNITIIGLGRIGASLGLALASHKDQVTLTGHDKLPDVARTAQKIGAVDKISYNLPASVEGADVVILALPFSEVYETLKIIAADIREDAVVMDTAPVKVTVAKWMKELLQSRRHYVGLTPALNPACLGEDTVGVGSARADLFQKSLVAITAPRGTVEGALSLAANFVTLIGARAYYADQAEVDGIMASVHFLPVLTAAALAGTVLDQPGWPDIRKLAGGAFARSTSLVYDEPPAALAAAALEDRENTLRVLDALLLTLQGMRVELAGGDGKALTARLEPARDGRERWWQERFKDDWLSLEAGQVEMPRMSQIMKQQIGALDKLFRRGKKEDED